MRPIVQITANGNDISGQINDRLISMTLTDESGIDADVLEIVLDDRDNALSLPSKGAELKIKLGFVETGVIDKGLFVVDELRVEGPPDQLIITARAADMRASLKERKTRSFNLITLGELVQTVANDHDLKPGISESLAATQVQHLDQTNESDMHMLSRLAKDYDAIATTKSGYLLFVNQGDAKSITGKPLPVIRVRKSDTVRHSFTFPDRNRYGSVIAKWHDRDKAETIQEKAGDGSPIYTIAKKFRNQQTAIEAANKKLSSLTRGTSTGQIEISTATKNGNFLQFVADGRAELTGFRQELNGLWSITRVEYSLSENLTAMIEVEVPN